MTSSASRRANRQPTRRLRHRPPSRQRNQSPNRPPSQRRHPPRNRRANQRMMTYSLRRPKKRPPRRPHRRPKSKRPMRTTTCSAKASAILAQPGGLASHSLRHWVDDTGTFSCQGRMLRMLDGKVQLLKDNGRTTTVPLARLSQSRPRVRQSPGQRPEGRSHRQDGPGIERLVELVKSRI